MESVIIDKIREKWRVEISQRVNSPKQIIPKTKNRDLNCKMTHRVKFVEHVTEHFKSTKFELLSAYYNESNLIVEFVCPEHKQQVKRWNAFKRSKHGCNSCKS